jgi:hypothetical protein
MASTFGGAFDRLPVDVQGGIIRSLKIRKVDYSAGLSGQRWKQAKVILVGDRPGNGGRLLPANHHHTPFYSTKNSSLWLNKQLVEAEIHENDLFWINAYDMDGTPSSHSHLEGWPSDPVIIALGGNAARWLKAGGFDHEQFYHPQAWKRFRSSEPYPLIDRLKEICST